MKTPFDDIEKDLKELDSFEPSMRFAKNVVEQARAERIIRKPARDLMFWIPRVCTACFALAIIVFVIIGLRYEAVSEGFMQNGILEAMILGLAGIAGFILFVGLDRILQRFSAR